VPQNPALNNPNVTKNNEGKHNIERYRIHAKIRRKVFFEHRSKLVRYNKVAKFLMAKKSQINIYLENRKRKGLTFLFKGTQLRWKSLRDNDWDWNHLMGHGYRYLIASRLWYDLCKRRLHVL